MSSAQGSRKPRPALEKPWVSSPTHQKKCESETYPTFGWAPNSDPSTPVSESMVSSPKPKKNPPRSVELDPTDQVAPPR